MQRFTVLVGLFGALATSGGAQVVADSACLRVQGAARDTLGRTYLLSTKLTRAQQRAYATLSEHFGRSCMAAADTLPPPPDTGALGAVARLLGPTRSWSDVAARGRGGLDSLFRAWEPGRWQTDWTAEAVTNRWATSNYYDRASILYVMAARSGNATYAARADSLAVNYRDHYLRPAQNRPAPWWWMPDGLAWHWLRTSDTLTRAALVGGIEAMDAGYWKLVGTTLHVDFDQRNRARLLQSYLLGWQLRLTSTVPFTARIDSLVTATLAHQGPDGAWRDAGRCGAQANFYAALVMDQLIRTHTHYRPDARIVAAVGRQLNYLWTTQLVRAGVLSFQYTDVASCVDAAGVETAGRYATPDLTGMFLHAFAWYGAKASAPVYTARADTLLRAAVAGGQNYSKQFNQILTSSSLTFGHLP